MTLEISFSLTDSDLERFRRLFRRARATARQTDRGQLLQKAAQRLDAAGAAELPDFVRERLLGLRDAVAMLTDAAWQLSSDDQERVLDAVAYFIVGNDLIPDSTPAIGLLDDAIAAELLLRALQHELDAYREFCRFRASETERRTMAGKPTDVSKQDWLTDQRARLHARIRERRDAEPAGWRTTMLGF